LKIRKFNGLENYNGDDSDKEEDEDKEDYNFSDEIVGAFDDELKILFKSKVVRKALWGLLQHEPHYNFIYFKVW
jgi:hypothetical protein